MSIIDDIVQVAERAQRAPKLLHVARAVEAESPSRRFWMEWISVEDRLPELKRRVLAYDHEGFGVLSARLGSAGWYLEGELDNNANITHWMPLPEPPAKPN